MKELHALISPQGKILWQHLGETVEDVWFSLANSPFLSEETARGEGYTVKKVKISIIE